jgi:hypothetical protein
MSDPNRPWLQDPVRLPTKTDDNSKPFLPEGQSGPTAQKPKQPSGKRDRFRIHRAFIDDTQRTLTGLECQIWETLWDYTDADTGLVSLSFNTLAELVGCNLRNARRALKSLIGKGLAKQVKKGNNLTHQASVYRVYATAKG